MRVKVFADFVGQRMLQKFCSTKVQVHNRRKVWLEANFIRERLVIFWSRLW